MMIVNVLLIIVALYLVLGLVFAVAFITKGVTKIDEGAHGATWGFRVIIIPGTIVFWPFLFKRWVKAVKTREQ